MANYRGNAAQKGGGNTTQFPKSTYKKATGVFGSSSPKVMCSVQLNEDAIALLASAKTGDEIVIFNVEGGKENHIGDLCLAVKG